MNTFLSTLLLISSLFSLVIIYFFLIVKPSERKRVAFRSFLIFVIIAYLITLLGGTIFKAPSIAIFLFLFSSLGLLPLFYATFFRRVLATDLVLNKQVTLEKENSSPLPKKEVAKQKYQKSNLQLARKEELAQKIIALVEGEACYLQADLTLPKLAKKVHLSTHCLSQIINEQIGCNFIDFINSYRVQAAMNKLRDTRYQHYTIVAVGYEVGFNSKSAFYKAFKKQTSMTPGHFRRSLKDA